jgi:putative endonuclease
MKYFVYILYSERLNKFYKGQTSDLKDRLFRHNAGREKATKSGIPWKLVWFCTKNNRSEAVILEIKIKNLSTLRTKKFILNNKPENAGPDDPLGMSGC